MTNSAKRSSFSGFAARLAAIYAAAGGAWLIISDWFIDGALALSPGGARVQIYKELGFVMASSVGLYLLLRLHVRRVEKQEAVYEAAAATNQENAFLWQNVAAAANVAILVLDENYRVLVCNDEAERLYGYPRDELCRMTLEDLRAPGERAKIATQMTGARDRRGGQWETVMQRKDGTFVAVEVTTRPFLLGRRESFAHVIHNIADRQRMIESLRESEERFRQLAENIREVFWLMELSPGGARRVVYVSPAFEEIWGRTCPSLDVAPGVWAEGIHPEDRRRVEQASDALVSTGKYDEEYRVIRPDDSVRWVHDQGFPVRNETGEIYRIAGLVEDITNRKQSELMMRESEARLNKSHYELVSSQQQLRALAQRLSTVREEEAKRIARELHDQLGHQLTALTMELNQMESDPSVTPALQSRCHRAREQADDALATVQGIAGELRVGLIDVVGISAAVEHQLREFSGRSGITCKIDRLDEVHGVPDRQAIAVYRILQEILTNVSRHSGAKMVSASLSTDHGQLWLIVHDNGCGITREDAGSPRAIGLLGMRERAQAVGGEIVIRGEAGRGTSVNVRVPLKTA